LKQKERPGVDNNVAAAGLKPLAVVAHRQKKGVSDQGGTCAATPGYGIKVGSFAGLLI
jgi:hypothetical protein